MDPFGLKIVAAPGSDSNGQAYIDYSVNMMMERSTTARRMLLPMLDPSVNFYVKVDSNIWVRNEYSIDNGPLITWNPYRGKRIDGCPTEKWHPPAISLFHELRHAWHDYDESTEFRWRTLNLHSTWKNEEEAFTVKEESRIAEEMGLGVRHTYTEGDGWNSIRTNHPLLSSPKSRSFWPWWPAN